MLKLRETDGDTGTSQGSGSDTNTQQNDGSYQAFISNIQRHAAQNPVYFGKPIPELTEEDLTPRTPPVKTVIAPGGGSLPYTSFVEGAANAEFPYTAWYKSKAGNIAARQKTVSEFYKAYQDPQAFATFQPAVDKFFRENFMGYVDNVVLPQYGQDGYRIMEGDVRNAKEAKTYQEVQQRYQYAQNLADHSLLVGKTVAEMQKAEQEGKYVDPRFKEKLAIFGSLGQHLDKIDYAEDMKFMNDTYNSFKILPGYIDSIDKLSKNPELRTIIGNAMMSNGGTIPGAYEMDKITAPAKSQLDNWTSTMYQQGYVSPNDPNPDDVNTPEGLQKRMFYIEQDIFNAAANKVESEIKFKPKGTSVSIKNKDIQEKYLPTAGDIFTDANNKYREDLRDAGDLKKLDFDKLKNMVYDLNLPSSSKYPLGDYVTPKGHVDTDTHQIVWNTTLSPGLMSKEMNYDIQEQAADGDLYTVDKAGKFVKLDSDTSKKIQSGDFFTQDEEGEKNHAKTGTTEPSKKDITVRTAKIQFVRGQLDENGKLKYALNEGDVGNRDQNKLSGAEPLMRIEYDVKQGNKTIPIYYYTRADNKEIMSIWNNKLGLSDISTEKNSQPDIAISTDAGE